MKNIFFIIDYFQHPALIDKTRLIIIKNSKVIFLCEKIKKIKICNNYSIFVSNKINNAL